MRSRSKSPGNQEKPRDSYPPRLLHLLPPGMCQLFVHSAFSPLLLSVFLSSFNYYVLYLCNVFLFDWLR